MTTMLPTGAPGGTDGIAATGRPGTLLRRLLAVATLGLLGTGTAQAQLSYAPAGAVYGTGTLASISSSGTPIATNFGGAAITTDDDNSAAQAIGFTFSFNGTSMTHFVLNTNGLVKLGSSSAMTAPSSAALYYAFAQTNTAGGATNSTNAADVNLVMPFHVDLLSGSGAGGATYQVQTTGTSPNRVCTIQWTNVADKAKLTNSTSGATNANQYASLVFQVKLYETTNRVQFVYGAPTASTATDAPKFAECGLRGNSTPATQLLTVTKGSGTAWTTPTSTQNAVYGGNSFNFRRTVAPVTGTTYTFSPTLANDANVAAVYTLTKLPIPTGTPHVVRASIANVGSAAYAGGTATLTITGPTGNAFTTTTAIPALAIGASSTLSFADYTPTASGTDTVTVSVSADDNAANNSRAVTQVVNASDYSYILPGNPTNARGFGPAVVGGAQTALFTTSTAVNVTDVRAQIVDFQAGGLGSTLGKTVYAAVFNAATGAELGRSANRVVTAADLTATPTIGSLVTFPLQSAITVPAGNFLVGLVQTYQMGETTQYYALGTQNQVPSRTGTFFSIQPPAAPADAAPAANSLLMLEAVTAPAPACAAVSGIAANTITTNSANVTFSAPGGAVDYTVTLSPTASGSPITATGSPVALSGLASGTTYTVSIVSNCGGGLTSSAATGSFTTAPATDASVAAIYTLTKLPIGSPITGFGGPHAVRAHFTNNGTSTITNVPVTLTVRDAANAVVFTDNTKTIATLAAGATTTTPITFDPYTPATTGAYTVTVTVNLPGDQVTGNDSRVENQAVNATDYAYADGSTPTFARGFGPGAGALFLSRFSTSTVRTITGTRAYLVDFGAMAGSTIGKTVYGVLVNATTGAILATSPAVVVGAGNINAYTTFTFSNAVTLAAGDFMVGLAQTYQTGQTTQYFPLGVQPQVPGRSGAFYTSSITGGTVPNDVGVATAARYMIEAVTANPPACGQVSGLTFVSRSDVAATIGFTAPVGSTVSNYTATLTQTVGGAVVSTQTITASPVSFSGLVSGVNYTLSIVTNCTSGGVSTATTATFSTLTNLVVSTSTPITGSYNNVTVTDMGVMSLSGDVNVAGVLTLEPGSVYNTDVVNTTLGAGRLVALPGSTIRINDGVGVTNTGSGAFNLAGGLDFGTDANFIFGGIVPQGTGASFPARVRSVTVNNTAPTVTNRTLFLDADLSVRQLVRLQSGNLDTDGSVLTLLSAANAGTALVDNTGGVVVGPATMQRATDVGGTIGYHHYSSPVAATTLADLDVPAASFANTYNAAYNGSATPGTVTPFPTVFGYDETRLATSPATALPDFDKGWFSPASSADPMVVGRGYTANIPNSLIVDFVGTFNNGPLNITGLTRGGGTEAGWHLLGNPYPAPLNWDNVAAGRRAGLDGFMYVANSNGRYTGTYRARQNGMGASPLIVAGSGFFVKTLAGQTGALNLLNSDRETTFGPQPVFGRGGADTRPQLTLTLANAAGTQADDAYVYLQAGATAAAEAFFDAPKLPNSSGLNLRLLAAGGEALSISGLAPLTGPALVPLTVGVPAVGSYVLTLGRLANFAGTNLVLRDNLTGVRTPLAASTSYRFAVSAFSTAGRFVLELNPAAGPLASAAQVLAAQVQVYPNPAHDRFTLTLPALAGSATAAATLCNALGQVVSVRTLALTTAGATAEFNTSALPTGIYALTLKLGNETITRRVTVE